MGKPLSGSEDQQRAYNPICHHSCFSWSSKERQRQHERDFGFQISLSQFKWGLLPLSSVKALQTLESTLFVTTIGTAAGPNTVDFSLSVPQLGEAGREACILCAKIKGTQCSWAHSERNCAWQPKYLLLRFRQSWSAARLFSLVGAAAKHGLQGAIHCSLLSPWQLIGLQWQAAVASQMDVMRLASLLSPLHTHQAGHMPASLAGQRWTLSASGKGKGSSFFPCPTQGANFPCYGTTPLLLAQP